MKYKGMARLDGRLIIHGWFKEISSLILIGKVAGMFLRDGKIIAVPEDIRDVLMQIYLPG